MTNINKIKNTDNNAEVAFVASFNKFMIPAEIAAVCCVTDEFAKRRFDVTCQEELDKLDSYTQSIFDSEMQVLNASENLRLRLNYISLMSIEIACNYIDSKAFMEKLYKTYSLETLFQIYKNARDEPNLRMGLAPLEPAELPYFQVRYLDIAHLLRVDDYLAQQKIENPSWEELEDLFNYAQPKSPVGLNYKSDSIDTNCQTLLSKSICEVNNILGNSTNLCIAFKCILSDAITDKDATILPLFSISTYYAAKAFAYIFPLISAEEQNIFVELDFWEQENALMDIILDDARPYTETIRNEYISSLLQSYQI